MKRSAPDTMEKHKQFRDNFSDFSSDDLMYIDTHQHHLKQAFNKCFQSEIKAIILESSVHVLVCGYVDDHKICKSQSELRKLFIPITTKKPTHLQLNFTALIAYLALHKLHRIMQMETYNAIKKKDLVQWSGKGVGQQVGSTIYLYKLL